MLFVLFRDTLPVITFNNYYYCFMMMMIMMMMMMMMMHLLGTKYEIKLRIFIVIVKQNLFDSNKNKKE
jgi:hypothetical protein